MWFDNNSLLNKPYPTLNTPLKVFIAVGELERRKYGQKYDMVSGAKQLAQQLKLWPADKAQIKFYEEPGHSKASAWARPWKSRRICPPGGTRSK